jgi:hypothetical protein
MARILYVDSDGVKSVLPTGVFGYDGYVAGGDEGRVYVGTASGNVQLARVDETNTALGLKVDKVAGKELSDNNYTDTEKATNNKIDNLNVTSVAFNADGTITIEV